MSPPNILVITTHDTGRHFGCYGVNTVHTPAIDALAATGVKCTNYFAGAPICCASRATMMTGRYPQSHGVMDLFFPPFDFEMHADERHLSKILRDAGYRTHLFGHQHETGQIDRVAFEKTWAAPARRFQSAHVVAAAVAEFLQNPPAEPFYAQIGFIETHSPYNFGDDQPDSSKGITVPPHLVANQPALDVMAKIQGSVRQVDAAVATIIDALERSGVAENTILVFTVDHGLELPRAKWTLYDPGIEIPLIVRWPKGGLTGGVCSGLLSNVDFVPTILELAGLPIPGNIQGRSFVTGLRGGATPREEIFALYQKSESRCVRTMRYKLIRNFLVAPGNWSTLPVNIAEPSRNRPTLPVELYDLTNDPREFINLANKPEHAETRRDLSERLWRWMEEQNDYILRGPPETPYYRHAIADYRASTRQSGA